MAAIKLNELKTCFTFDDLLILPAASSVEPKEAKTLSVLTKMIKLNVPVISSPMDTVTESSMAIELARNGAIGAIHRNMTSEKEVEEIKKVKGADVDNEFATVDEEGKLRVVGAIGPFDIDRARRLDKVGADAIIIDCAHGHNLNVLNSAKKIKKEISCELIVGNIATPQAAVDYLQVEPDAFRVGIGSGSICSTRIVTGVGVPQASAINEVYEAVKEYKIPIIADGGIKTSGDIVKALALGADSVMLGNLLAGTDEAAGKIIDGSVIGKEGKYKLYRGMGSKSVFANTDRYMLSSKFAPEGVEGVVQHKGPVKNILEEFVWAIKQGMGYVGAERVSDMKNKVRFVQITSSSLKENYPHSIIQISTELWKELMKKK